VLVRRNGPSVFGWLWFLIALAPVSGILVQVGGQAHADRYAYVPHIGLLTGLVWEAREICLRLRHGRYFGAVLTLATVVWWTAATRHQAATWRDSETLWNRALAVAPNCPTALIHLAFADLADGRGSAAAERFTAVLDHSPGHVAAIVGLGKAAAMGGDGRRARAYFDWALRLEPRRGEALAGRAALPADTVPTPPRPASPQAVAANREGLVAARKGALSRALECFEQAIALDPNFLAARTNAALAYETKGRPVDGRRHLEAALQIDPNSVEAFHALRRVYSETGSPMPPNPM